MILSLFLGNLLHKLQEVFLAEAKAIARKAAAARAQSRLKMKAAKRARLTKNKDVAVSLAVGRIRVDFSAPREEQERVAAIIIQRAWMNYQSVETDPLSDSDM
eukprot:SAG31_NODE_37234_length_306_cov_0.724638_1_plen_102_part_11